MIEKGWRRRNDVCPQCHMPGRVAQRDSAIGKDNTPEQIKDACLFTLVYSRLNMKVMVDVCDNCGVLYALRAE